MNALRDDTLRSSTPSRIRRLRKARRSPGLERCAIRCRFVDTSTGSDAPAMFPSNGVMTRCPLPSAGSLRNRFPGFRGTMGHSDSPPSVSPRFVAFAGRYHRCIAGLLPSGGDARSGGSGELVVRFPSRKLRWRRRGLPGSWGTLMVIARALRPRQDRPRSPGPSVARPARPPHMSTTKAPSGLIFRGSITRPLTWLPTLRSESRPSPRKTRFWLLARLCQAGLDTRRVPTRGF